MKYINNAVIKYSNNNKTPDIIIMNTILDYLIAKRIEEQTIQDNIHATSIQSQNYSIMEIDKSIILQQIVDIPDFDSLKEFNNKYFKQYPLNLNFLCKEISPFRKYSYWEINK